MPSITNKTTAEKIWTTLDRITEKNEEMRQNLQKMSEEADKRREEADKRREEADKRREEADKQMQKMSEEADKRRDEADKRMQKMSEEADKRQKIAEKRMCQLDELFTGQWGKLMESLVKGDLVKLLNQKGILVQGLSKETSRKFNNKEYEFDIVAVNGNEVVVVEVKTTLKLKNVDYFIRKLKDFKVVFSEYKEKTIYGAIAYLKSDESSAKNAEKKGLFVIRATGNSSSITNAPHFRPKIF